MRTRETHYEQVPIEIVEAVLDESTAPGTVRKKLPGQVPAVKRSPKTETQEQTRFGTSKGPQ